MKQKMKHLAVFLTTLMLVFGASLAVTFTNMTADAAEGVTAKFGTPKLGTNDPLWSETAEIKIDKRKSVLEPGQSTTGNPATGIARVLWDEDFLYVRAEITDDDVCFSGAGEHMSDSVEFFVGRGTRGVNQWRISAGGTMSGATAAGREGWAEQSADGYTVEMKIPRRTVEFTNNAPITFDVGINNSTGAGNSRYEVVCALGEPDGAYFSDASYQDSLTLLGAPEGVRHIVNATSGGNGVISPSGLIRVADGEDQVFTLTPNEGYVVDELVVDGKPVNVEGNTYTLENVTADGRTIHATFKPDPNAEKLDFIVYNDNFATGEFTTAVIIDLGSKTVKTADLNKEMFRVSYMNTFLNGDAAYQGQSKVTRVYANDEPRPLGYLGAGGQSPNYVNGNSPDYKEGLEKGRYIVIELEFWTKTGGRWTIESYNSTKQNYRIVANQNIKLSDSANIENAVFVQTATVNEIIDQFEKGEQIPGKPMEYAFYDAGGKNRPLYIYAHGSTRGGTQADDYLSPLKTTNGSIELLRRINKGSIEPAYIISMRATNNRHATPEVLKAYIDKLIADGLVDENRIYMAGFSMGGGFTNSFVNAYPKVLAAAAPMSMSPSPSEETIAQNPALAFWSFTNATDNVASTAASGAREFASGNMKKMSNARITIIERNEIFSWPFDQWTKEQIPINGTNWEQRGHEMEASVLYSSFSEYKGTLYNVGSSKPWSLKPEAQSEGLDEWTNYSDVFDWMFAQDKRPVNERPHSITVTDGVADPMTAVAGTIITITANDPPKGKVFDKWTSEDDVTFVDATAATTTFTMPAKAVTITATYKSAGKLEQKAPSAPTLASKTSTTITLKEIAGAEYRRDNGEWQDSPVFSGLTPNTNYQFTARMKETATHAASPASESLSVKTDSAKSNPSGFPKTGDTNNTGVLLALLGLSAAGIGVLAYYKRRKKMLTK